MPDGEEPVDVCMMHPEYGIKTCVGNITHVPSISDQTVDSVVHVLEGVVRSAPAVCESGIGERCVVGLIGNQLISRVVDGLSIGLELQVG